MSDPFFILAAPRSRTAWLAAWLSYGERTCWHDALAVAGDVEGLRAMADESVCGFAETAGCFFPRTLHKTFPGAKYLFVTRLTQRIVESLNRLGKDGEAVAWHANKALQETIEILRERGAEMMFVAMEHLDDPETLSKVWSFLRDDIMPTDHTLLMLQMQITKKRPFDGRLNVHALLREDQLAEEERTA